MNKKMECSSLYPQTFSGCIPRTTLLWDGGSFNRFSALYERYIRCGSDFLRYFARVEVTSTLFTRSPKSLVLAQRSESIDSRSSSLVPLMFYRSLFQQIQYPPITHICCSDENEMSCKIKYSLCFSLKSRTKIFQFRFINRFHQAAKLS